MNKDNYLVIGGNGLVGKSIVNRLKLEKKDVISIGTGNYNDFIGEKTNILINANGNSYRFKANNEPFWDYKKSIQSVYNSFNDFRYDKYIYLSTVDVYNNLYNPSRNSEEVNIEPSKLDYYGFHKWVSERLVEKYCANSIILRLGTVLGKNLKKGPIFDLVNNNQLHISKKSQLTFVDTETISDVVLGLVKMNKNNEIYNLTGSGFVELNHLINIFSFQNLSKIENKRIIHKYNINIKKINSYFHLPTSIEIAENFIKNKYKL